MQINRFIFVVLFFFSLNSVNAHNGQLLHLSLKEALELSKTHSYQLQIARSQLGGAEGKNLESWSGFLPRFTFSENYIRSNDPVIAFSLKLKQGIFAQQDFSLDELNSPSAIGNFATAFQVQQPLLNLDAIYGKSAAHLAVKAREESLKRVREAVNLQVKKAYYGLILARENAQAIEEALSSARRHLNDARAAFDQGMATQADLLAAKVRLAELEEQQISAQHTIANASDGLKFVIGIQDERLVVPEDTLTVPQKPQPHFDGQAQVTDRSDLRALHFQTLAARRNLGMKRSGWLPRVNAFGTVEWNASQAFSKNASNWALGVQLQWKLFDGLGHWGRAKQAKAQVEEAQVHLRQAEEQAKLEMRKAQRAVEAAKERIQVAQTAVEQARESLRIVEERFKEGLEKTSDLLDKEVALTHARLRLLKAKHDYNVAISEMQFALGEST